MRLFFAVELPDEVKERVFEAERELEEKGISLVKKENLHITLKFIGEKSEQECEEIIKKTSEIEFEPFSVRVAGVGAFPNERNARVIWAGAQAIRQKGEGKRAKNGEDGDLRAEIDCLGELAHKIEGTLGIKKEEFTGHITIARVRERADLRDFFQGNGKKEFGEFLANAFVLKKSTLSPQGAAYENVKEFFAGGKGIKRKGEKGGI